MKIQVHLDQVELHGIDGIDSEQIRTALAGELTRLAQRPLRDASDAQRSQVESPSQSIARQVSAEVSAVIDQI